MNRSDILAKLRDFPYDPGEYWVITGGAMVLYDLREETSDLDLGCTPRLADQLEAGGFLHQVTPDGNRWFKLGGDVEIFENWLFDTVTSVDGVPVISLRGLLRMKQALGREKDRRDAERILARLRQTGPEEPA